MLDVGELGEAFKKLRGELSQEALSGLAGLDRTHLSNIERGRRCPTLNTLFKLAYAFNMQPWELLKKLQEIMSFDINEFVEKNEDERVRNEKNNPPQKP